MFLIPDVALSWDGRVYSSACLSLHSSVLLSRSDPLTAAQWWHLAFFFHLRSIYCSDPTSRFLVSVASSSDTVWRIPAAGKRKRCGVSVFLRLRSRGRWAVIWAKLSAQRPSASSYQWMFEPLLLVPVCSPAPNQLLLRSCFSDWLQIH